MPGRFRLACEAVDWLLFRGGRVLGAERGIASSLRLSLNFRRMGVGRNGIRGKAGDAGSKESGGWELLGGSILVLLVGSVVMESVSGWLGLRGESCCPTWSPLPSPTLAWETGSPIWIIVPLRLYLLGRGAFPKQTWVLSRRGIEPLLFQLVILAKALLPSLQPWRWGT